MTASSLRMAAQSATLYGFALDQSSVEDHQPWIALSRGAESRHP